MGRKGGEMNIYQKMNEAKLRIAALNLKMGGFNSHSKYNYFELEDFLGELNKICSEIGLYNHVTFGLDIASLTTTDTDKPEDTLITTSPMSSAKLPGCHDVQNLGAVETYIKRYLYQTAYDIVEKSDTDRNPVTDQPIPMGQKNDEKKSFRASVKEQLVKSNNISDQEKKPWLDAWEKLTDSKIKELKTMLEGLEND